MDVLWVGSTGTQVCEPRDLPRLLERTDGFVWFDIPEFDDEAQTVLVENFGFHLQAIKECAKRTHVPKIYPYTDHLFLTLHSPEAGDPGHIHLLELKQFVGLHYLVTVHGPLGEGASLKRALYDTQATRQRIESGRFKPKSPAEVSHAIVSSSARGQETFLGGLADKVAHLERWALEGGAKDPEQALEDLFRLRHELLTLRTMSAQSREVYTRMKALARYLPEEVHQSVDDLVDQFARVRSLAQEEMDFLQGVVDFYQSRTTTKMNIAMERLALIAALILPITAVAGIFGMNIIVPEATSPVQILVVLIFMIVMSSSMLIWAKRHGWW